jgi:hypothetical protein
VANLVNNIIDNHNEIKIGTIKTFFFHSVDKREKEKPAISAELKIMR